MGSVFTVSYSSLLSTAGEKDLIHLLASTDDRVEIRAVNVFQSTTGYSGSSDDELTTVRIMRGHSGAAAGGSTGGAVRMGASGQSTGTAKIDVNSSTPAGGGTVLYAGQCRTGQPFCWRPDPDERPVVGLEERLSVRLGPVGKVVTMGCSMTFEEIGKLPGESL